ncbi:BID domain-containing T4SS effector [Bartonella taylorii]|uniref:BID domain-containing T4SS effector n=1 Tax=Bartonella taylorii TaxID=33046 RepID=A0A9Q8Z1S6_BARTA|nr:BID domain-containing T4SS effector [Bartonella taylorii]USP03605.1 BID domain-containing T4SS effector [Bartonella taylorii]
MKKNHPSPSPQANPEVLYAEVNKPNRKQHPTQQTAPEELYAKVNKPPRQRSPQSEETIYAPQKPLGNPYDRLGGKPSDGRRTDRLVDPYTVTDLEASNWGEPYYSTVGEGAHGRQRPEKPEHLYAELDFGENAGPSPKKPVESVYATVGIGAQGGQDSLQRENPIYEGLNTGRTTPPPKSPKDEITSKLLKDVHFQYGVRETQEWCKVVFGNEHALNTQLARILDNPREGENVLWEVAGNPEGVGKLAGTKVLGVKSPSRKEAEDGFGPLCAALERHVKTAQKLHKDLTREQAKQQGHERGESPERHGEHRHHHHRHAREERQTSPQREVQPRSRHEGGKGMAFAM